MSSTLEAVDAPFVADSDPVPRAVLIASNAPVTAAPTRQANSPRRQLEQARKRG
ncbi:hypothetical protein AB0F36_36150 [Streptomyces sp. NPDC029080]|uniref:hypothetical protein n=1 Tax=Streptomyces sp. NPDC029080 TaxID=3155017 RepID=UPI0033CF5C74